MTHSLRVFAACVLGFLCSSASAGTSQSVFYIGTSLTNRMSFDGMAKLAEMGGNTNTYASQIIPGGTSLYWQWTHDDGYSLNLRYRTWDIVSLQSSSRDLSGNINGTTGEDEGDVPNAQKFIDLTRTRAQNAQTRFFLFQRWVLIPGSNEVDYKTAWDRPYVRGTDTRNSCRDYFDQYIQAIHANNPAIADQIVVLPMGDVMYELNDRMRDGQFSAWGMDDITDIYEDNNHLINVGEYLEACVFYATIYKQSPVGLGVPTEFAPLPYNAAFRNQNQVITPALANALQDVAWDVVSTHPYTAVPEPASLTILLVGGLLICRRWRDDEHR